MCTALSQYMLLHNIKDKIISKTAMNSIESQTLGAGLSKIQLMPPQPQRISHILGLLPLPFQLTSPIEGDWKHSTVLPSPEWYAPICWEPKVT